MSKSALPQLGRLEEQEARAVEAMFRLYDHKSTGRIPAHLAQCLCKQLGIDIALHMLPPNGTLKDLLMVIDQKIPDPAPPLPGSMSSFVNLVGRPRESHPESEEGGGNKEGKGRGDNPFEKVITTANITAFLQSLGRPPIQRGEGQLLLQMMLDYDDCTVEAVVPVADFAADMTTYARKTNSIKDL